MDTSLSGALMLREALRREQAESRVPAPAPQAVSERSSCRERSWVSRWRTALFGAEACPGCEGCAG